MTSDGRGRGGSAKSVFISKEALIKHLMRGEWGSKKAKIIRHHTWMAPWLTKEFHDCHDINLHHAFFLLHIAKRFMLQLPTALNSYLYPSCFIVLQNICQNYSSYICFVREHVTLETLLFASLLGHKVQFPKQHGPSKLGIIIPQRHF